MVVDTMRPNIVVDVSGSATERDVTFMVDDQKLALERVFRQNERVLLRWLVKKLGDMESAHDVAQSTFLNLWKYSNSHEIENPKALIFRTAANLALNELRRRRRFFRRNILTNELVEIGPLRHRPSLEPTPEEAASLRQEAKILLAAIDKLPPKPRDAYKLHRFEGMSYKQIAEKQGVSVSSVEKYMIEALSVLRRIILPDVTDKPRTLKPKLDERKPSRIDEARLVLAKDSDEAND